MEKRKVKSIYNKLIFILKSVGPNLEIKKIML